MTARKWAVWSWDTGNRRWVAVAEGTSAEMQKTLDQKRAAAARAMPSARFVRTPLSSPPSYVPDTYVAPADGSARAKGAWRSDPGPAGPGPQPDYLTPEQHLAEARRLLWVINNEIQSGTSATHCTTGELAVIALAHAITAVVVQDFEDLG